MASTMDAPATAVGDVDLVAGRVTLAGDNCRRSSNARSRGAMGAISVVGRESPEPDSRSAPSREAEGRNRRGSRSGTRSVERRSSSADAPAAVADRVRRFEVGRATARRADIDANGAA
jgi:hypothetical protein